MAEPEVDALMQGQEDENGSVNYESKANLNSMGSPKWRAYR